MDSKESWCSVLKISDYGILSGLILVSVYDIRRRRIPVQLLVLFSAAIIGYRIYDRGMDIGLIAGGAGIGIFFFIVSKRSGESIGYADSWMILLLGIYLGFWGILGTLTGTMFILAVVSLVFVVIKRRSKKLVLPFLPFLTAGYLLWLVSEI